MASNWDQELDCAALLGQSNNPQESSSSILTRKFPKILQFEKRFGKQTKRTILPRHLSRSEHCPESLQPLKKLHEEFSNNEIRTTKYTVLSFIPKNLFEQFHRLANCYFVFIILLNFFPEISAIEPFLSMVPVIGILSVQAIKDLVEDYGRYKSDIEVNCSKTEVNLSDGDKYSTVKWSKVQVGDIVRVVCNSVIPADVLLLHTSNPDGRCFIETSNIDGESNLKQRTTVKRHCSLENTKDFRPTEFDCIVECQAPNNEIYKFHGNIIPPGNTDKIPINNSNLLLRGCVLKNTDYVEGLVVYAGHETKAMLNNNGPRYKRSKLERRVNTHVVYCLVLLIVMCAIGAAGNAVWTRRQTLNNQSELFLPEDTKGDIVSWYLSGFYMFWTMVVVLQVLIPISLYVSLELVKSVQVYMINQDVDLYHQETDTPMKCRALNIPEDLGQIQYVFSDKTGTLTENEMVFRRCTIGGVNYPHAANGARIENLEAAPVDLNPSHCCLLDSEAPHPNEDSPLHHTYRRHGPGPMKPHHRRNLEQDHCQSRSIQKSVRTSTSSYPVTTKKRSGSIKKQAAHHRRSMSSASAKEVGASVSHDGNMEEKLFVEAQSSDDAVTNVTPNPVLFAKFQSIQKHDNFTELHADEERILDFFITLAICNTVVISNDIGESCTMDSKTLEDTSDVAATSSSDSSEVFHHSKPQGTKGVHCGTGDGFSSENMRTRSAERKERCTIEPTAIRYEAESPDEAALVYASHAYDCVLTSRACAQGEEFVTIALPQRGETITFQVLHKLSFDPRRKRMSVIVRDQVTGRITLYCKGADSTMLPRLAQPPTSQSNHTASELVEAPSNEPSNSTRVVEMTSRCIDGYARAGLRTLCMAKKMLTDVEYRDWLKEYKRADCSFVNRDELMMKCVDDMEADLELLGATGVEDRLQEGVPETIEALREAGIQVWVVTGDKQETAINIGHSCCLVQPMDEVVTLDVDNKEALSDLLDKHLRKQNQRQCNPPSHLQSTSSISHYLDFFFASSKVANHHPSLVLVINGKTLTFALQKDLQSRFVDLARRCRSVLCCRVTPLQKGEVVKLIKHELKVTTLAIGDGANDVSMIQVADVGIGLSGQEGMQAVMSCDYALAQFRFLRKLLLVHGHWSYARLTSMVLYFFYKNAAFVFLIFWYQLFCGFSGGNMIEQWYLILFNLIFTSAPPLVNGALDKDLKKEVLLQKPSLYKQGINDELYSERSFWINILDAIYQSTVVFFAIYLVYQDSEVGVIEWGTVVTSASLFVILIHLAIETKTWTWIHWFFQVLSIFIFFAFALIYNAVCPACSPPSNPYFIMERLVRTYRFWSSILLVVVVALLPRYVIRVIQSAFFPTECQRERVSERYRTRNHSSLVSTPLTASTIISEDSTCDIHPYNPTA